MVDLENERPLTLNEARRLAYLKGRGGTNVSLCTIYRWAIRGVGGVRLETAKVGGTVVTTAEAVMRFVEALSSPAATRPASLPSVRRRQIEHADRRLDQADI